MQTFARTLNAFNNIAKTYSNIDRIRSIMKNAIMIKMNIFERLKKRRNSNVSIQILFQILIEKYDDATFFIIEFWLFLNLIRTNRELKHKFNDFFTTNRAKTFFNIFNVFWIFFTFYRTFQIDRRTNRQFQFFFSFTNFIFRHFFEYFDFINRKTNVFDIFSSFTNFIFF